MAGVTNRTKMAVIGLAGGVCAFPGCSVPYYDEARDTRLGQVAHICAQSPGGPRFDPMQIAAERDGIANLLLLCDTHHTEVDRHPEKYTVSVLQRWKAEHDERAEDPPPAVLAKIAASLGEMSTHSVRTAMATERVADLLESRAAPKFEIAGTPGGYLASRFTPEWEIEQSGGRPLRQVRYRFLGGAIRPSDVGGSFKDGRLMDQGGRRYLNTRGEFDLTRAVEPVQAWPGLLPEQLGFELQWEDPHGTWRSKRWRVPFRVDTLPESGKRLVRIERPFPD